MAISYLEDGRIADNFEIGEEPHVLKDALVMYPNEYEKLSADEIQSMKQARYDNWFAIIMAAPAEEQVQ